MIGFISNESPAAHLGLVTNCITTAGLVALAVALSNRPVSAEDLLSLLVNRSTGHVQIENSSLFSSGAISFDAYQIASAGGSLNVFGWNSLHDQQVGGPGTWVELATPNDFNLAEAQLVGSTTINPFGALSLGNPYDSLLDLQDLTFSFLKAGGSLLAGPVVYVGAPFPVPVVGDYNADGIVDALDAALWADNLGMVVPPGSGGDGNGNGIVDAADYQIIVANLGNTDGGGTPDPTPASLIYNAVNGRVTLDQSDAAGGKMTAFILKSPTNALVPGSAQFPYTIPADTGFANAQQLGQIDVDIAGLPATQFLLGPVLPAGLDLAQLQAALSGSFYMPTPGNIGSSFILIVAVPEPATWLAAVLAALLLLPRLVRTAWATTR